MYPPFMNPSIPWPPGVRFGKPLLQQHDLLLFANTMGQLRYAFLAAAASPTAPPTSGKGLPTARKQKSVKTVAPASDATATASDATATASDATVHGKGSQRGRPSRRSTAAEATFSDQQDRSFIPTILRLSHRHHPAGSAGYLPRALPVHHVSAGYLPRALPVHHASAFANFVLCRRLI